MTGPVVFPNQQQFAVAALYTNYTEINFTSFGARLAFGESPDASKRDNRWHSTVFMPWPVFEGFVNLVNGVAENVKQQREAAANSTQQKPTKQ